MLKTVYITIFIVINLVINSIPTPYIVTEYRSKQSEEILWNLLCEYAPNEYIAAGALGYFKRESELRSNATAGWPTAFVCTGIDHCIVFTEQIDKGLKDGSTKEEFIQKARYQYGGYGLGQWCTVNMLENYYEFAREWGTSISDAEMQCAFLMYDIETRRPELWEKLLEVDNPIDAGCLIGKFYDGTAAFGYIGQLAGNYYEAFKEN